MNRTDGAPDKPSGTSAAGSWYLLALLFFVYMFSSVDRMVIGLIVEPLKADFHVTDAQIGFLSGFAYSIPFAIVSLPIGVLVDRLPRVKLLALIMSVWSLMTSVGWLASSFVTLAAARMAVGAAEAGVIPAGFSLMADAFPPKRRAAAMGVFYAGTLVSPLIVFIAGAYVLAHFGWREVFLIAGAPGLIIAALLATTAREPLRAAFEAPRSPSELKPKLTQTVRLVVANPAIRHTIIANTITAGVTGTFGFWCVSFFARIHHIPFKEAAMIVGLALGIAGTCGALISGPIIDRVARGDPARTAMFPTVTTLCGGIAGLVMVTATSLPLVIGAYATLCLMFGASVAPGHVLLLGVSPGHIRGSISSIDKLLSILLGAGVFSWMAGAISDHVGGTDGIRVGLTAVICFLFLSALFFHLAGRAWTRLAISQKIK